MGEPGVHFTFAQDMLPVSKGTGYRYDFPLGTGPAWHAPVTNTLIYVTGPEKLNLKADFPKPMNFIEEPAPGYPRDFPETGVGQGRQVYFGSYGGYQGDSPAEDIAITLRATGRSPAVSARRSLQWRAFMAHVFFPALGILAWLAAFSIVSRGPDVADRASWWQTCGESWLALQVMVTLPLLLFLHGPEWVDQFRPRYVMEDLWRDQYSAGVLTAGLLIVILLVWYLFLRVLTKGGPEHATQWLWRVPVGLGLSAVLYLGLGSLAAGLRPGPLAFELRPEEQVARRPPAGPPFP